MSPALSPRPRRQGFEPISPPPGATGSPPSYAAYYGKAELLGKMKELPEVAEGSSEEEEEVDRELVEKKVTGMGLPNGEHWLHVSVCARMVAALLIRARLPSSVCARLSAGCTPPIVQGCWLRASSVQGCCLHSPVCARLMAACICLCKDGGWLHASVCARVVAASLIRARLLAACLIRARVVAAFICARLLAGCTPPFVQGRWLYASTRARLLAASFQRRAAPCGASTPGPPQQHPHLPHPSCSCSWWRA